MSRPERYSGVLGLICSGREDILCSAGDPKGIDGHICIIKFLLDKSSKE